ncbi:MAG: zf-HC2 domain-containing protein [Anaerolineae bacterium]|nr:zf-HC2 domain-containing protein [Anaerolineae bacterium]MDW8069455.1 zf-HC2 domain-containing protein [Anaerolineae bacterium]
MLGKKRVQEKTDEWLSAYIDGALSPRERARLEARLAEDADLRARLESLRQVVVLVREMPPVRAPRNFLLTPTMVQRPARVARRLAPALTFATALTGLLCVILLVGNLLAAGWGGGGGAVPLPMAEYPKAPHQPLRGPLGEKDQETAMALANTETPPSPVIETPLAEWSLLEQTVTLEEAAPARALEEDAPHPLESAESAMGGGGGGPGLFPGEGYGEGAEGIGGEMEEQEPFSPEPREDRVESVATLTPSLEPTPLTAEKIVATPVTPSPTSLSKPDGTPIPVEQPEQGPPLPLLSWWLVGGLALLTAVLAVLSVRAWRAE